MTSFTLTDRRFLRGPLALVAAGSIIAAGGLLGACGTSRHSSSTTVVQTTSLVGKRYCEVLLVSTDGGLHATVYNTYPLNACPASKWNALDAPELATQNGAVAALLNGPRYWLMDSIAKTTTGARVTATFGDIEMIKEATVALTPADLSAQRASYTPHTVNRSASFTFNAGRRVYELHDPSGQRWIMQTWSQQVDPSLSESQLATLDTRLELPSGWSYTTRTLATPLVVATQSTAAHVLQDNLDNSYSLETSHAAR